MEPSVKVSIIMPSLNVAMYIDEAIRSVRNQTLRDIEILCIDAGSTDGTIDIITKHMSEDSRVKYIPCEVKSYGYQVNTGIKIMAGEYFGIVETDDYVDSKMYEKLYRVADENKLDFVKADYKAFFSQADGEKFFLNRKNFFNNDLYEKVLCPKCYPEVATGDWYNCQGIYNTSYIKNNKILFSETPGAAFQDIGFLYFAIVKAQKVMYLPDSFYRYRIDREDSSSNSGRGIKYSYDEFSRLFSMIEGKEVIENNELKFLYIRMAKSFVSSYGDLRGKEIGLDSKQRNVYYGWFKEKMRTAIDSRIIVADDIQKSIWDSLIALLESEDALRNLQMKEDVISNLAVKVENDSSSKVVIFGCGNYGFDAYKNICSRNIEISAFSDNNSDLWGKTLEGIEIVAPEKIKMFGENMYIVVANELHHQEIRKQLIDMGIKTESILIYGRAFS